MPNIRLGLYIPWKKPTPPHIQDAYELHTKELAFSNKTVDAWCAAMSVNEVAPSEAAKLKPLAPSFVVHMGKHSLVFDLRERNAFIDDLKFVDEQLPGLINRLVPHAYLVSWDIKDAFHSICLLPADRLRLAFRISDRIFLPNLLPFGLRLAPWALTRLMRPIVAALRQLGFTQLSFCGDFGGAAPGDRPSSKAPATAGRAAALALFARLGV